ncbi:MAG: CBS domain-containing protein [Nitrospirae bacterium]|nr:MAG: CBS domain-containing protein [Nitrospirota bacterium]
MLLARDIMNTNIVTVTPETTVGELGRLFLDKGISGAPVIDSENRLQGIVTENDLIRQNRRFHIPTIVRLFDAFIPLEGSSSIEKEIRRMSAATVADICTRDVITTGPDATLQDIASTMSDKNVHLIPVLDDGRLVGIIGKIDLIKGTLGEGHQQ